MCIYSHKHTCIYTSMHTHKSLIHRTIHIYTDTSNPIHPHSILFCLCSFYLYVHFPTVIIQAPNNINSIIHSLKIVSALVCSYHQNKRNKENNSRCVCNTVCLSHSAPNWGYIIQYCVNKLLELFLHSFFFIFQYTVFIWLLINNYVHLF